MTVETTIKAIGVTVATAGLLFGIIEFVRVQEIEAQKPYLERKLAWCEEAVETAARIANAQPLDPKDVTRFWQMYWGVMGLIEKQSITVAMVDYGTTLRTITGEAGSNNALRRKSLNLAHACRKELSHEWSPSWSR